MQISFFEEFPTKQNLAKLKYISFPTKVYMAAHSLQEFENIFIASKMVQEKIYWPILEKKEGYWFSPFSKRRAVKKIFNELQGKRVPVMIDAELPTHPNPFLYCTEFPFFFSTRNDIRFFVAHHGRVYTAEYFPSSKCAEAIFSFLGLSFTSKNHHPIKMFYSSMHDFGEAFLRRRIQKLQKEYGNNLCIGLGTLTHGIRGDEPAISKTLLERDLHICKETGIQEVILFRLGGMNKEYQRIINQFSQ